MPDSDQVRVELDALKGDLDAIRSDLGDLLKAVRSEGRGRAAHTAGKVQEEAMRRFEQLRDVFDNAKGASQKAYYKAQRKVEERPMVSIVAALAIGMVLGRLLLGNRR